MSFLTACEDSSSESQSGGGLFQAGGVNANNFFNIQLNAAQTFSETENIDITLTHPYVLTVTGSPRLPIDLGGVTAYADFITGSNTKTLVFRYTVQVGDNDLDGIELGNQIDLNSGSITYSDKGVVTDATTELPNKSTPNHIVDTVSPQIENIIVPINASYKEGDQLNFILDFNEDLNVIGSSKIAINLGGATIEPTLSNHVNDQLTYSYTVQAGDNDSDGLAFDSTSLTITSGSIIDNGGNLANLTLNSLVSLPNLSGVLVDTIVPTISIDTAAAIGLGNYTAYTISGSCSEESASISIDLESINVTTSCSGGSWSSGAVDVSGIVDSSNFSLMATISDAATNSSNDLTTVVKDTTVSSVTITAPSDINFSNQSSYSIAGTCSVDGVLVDVNIGALNFQQNCSGGAWSFTGLDVSSIADSATVSITADHSTAPQATATIIKDVVVPTISIDSAPDANLANYTAYAASGTCSEDTEVVDVNIGSVNIQPTCTGGAWNISGVDLTAVADNASISFTIDHSDANQVSTTIAKDVVAPEVSSVTPSGNAYYVENDTISFTVATSENVNISGNPRLQIDLGGSLVYATLASGDGTSSLVFNYQVQNGDLDLDGIAFNISTIDLNSGSILDGLDNPIHLNLDANTALPNTSGILVDAGVPTVTITDASNITGANELIYFATGTCSENGRIVNVSIGTINLTPTCSAGVWNTGSVDVSALADNPSLSIIADHSDAAGNNAAQASTTVDKNSAVPQVAITSAPNITAANHTGYQVLGTCSENGRVVDVFVGSLNVQPNCSGGSWNTGYVDISGQADSASFTITADHDDGTISATQASVTVDKTTTGDLVTITSAPNINIGNETSYIASGTCSNNGVMVDIFIDSLNFQPNCNNGTWTTGVQDVSSIPDGSGINVTADHAAATQAATTINKDSATPTVASLSAFSTLKDSSDLNWTLNDPGGYTINDYQINYRTFGSSTWLTFNDGVSIDTLESVTGLLPSTTYEFRVRVQYDSSNYSDWSAIASATTKPDNPLFDSPYKAMNVGGATETKVVAYYDNTRVYINDVEIASSPLSAGQVVYLSQAPDNITTSQFDVIDADKPIFTAGRFGSGGNTSKGNIVWQPTAWAGKSFSFNAIRSNPQQVFIYATENSVVEAKQGNTVLDSATISAGSGATLSYSVYGSFQIISTGTILAYHISGNLAGGGVQDPKPLLPSHTEIIGFPSNSMRLTTDLDGTNYNAIHSNSTTASGNLNKANVVQINPQGTPTSLYQSDSLVISADKKIAGASFADNNGNAAAPFLPTNLMRKRYAINNSADYVAFASKQAGTIEVYSPGQVIGTDTPVQSLTLTRSGANPNAPYRVRRGATPSGYRFVSTVPMAGWYQPDNDNGTADQDETILYGTDELP